LQNPNDFNVKCILNANSLNENQEKLEENLFLFDNNQDKFLVTQLEEIKANRQMKFKIRFQPINMRNSFQSSICNGLIKITAIGHELRFNVQMIGFINFPYLMSTGKLSITFPQ
jgi:hypothetical protein